MVDKDHQQRAARHRDCSEPFKPILAFGGTTRRNFVRCGVAVLMVCLCLGVGCRSTVYSAYEKFGVYKRDLLKRDVKQARDAQAQAQEQFKDALTRLREITHFEGGELERRYNALKGEYDACAAKAEHVRKRIRDVEQVSSDLFAEWEKENRQIETASLRASSEDQLSVTRAKYADLHRALTRAEESMEPVLRRFNDYVLYLKHSLNAQAMASLQGEAAGIQTDISSLIEEMNRSIERADDFIKTMK